MKLSESDFEGAALALVDGEPNLIANLANLSAHIFQSIPGLNWAGFYLWDERDQQLVLGPFQGKPACVRISPNKGVCGKAFSERQTQRVFDVHEVPYHIACDSASRSELVVPLFKGENCIGVLDLDAPTVGFFDEELQQRVESLVRALREKL